MMKHGKSSVTTTTARSASCAAGRGRVRRRFDEGPIVEPELLRLGEVVEHAFENEAVQPLTRPRIAELQALVDDERLLMVGGACEGVVEGVIGVEAAVDLHPVEDVVAAAARVAELTCRRRTAL